MPKWAYVIQAAASYVVGDCFAAEPSARTPTNLPATLLAGGATAISGLRGGGTPTAAKGVGLRMNSNTYGGEKNLSQLGTVVIFALPQYC